MEYLRTVADENDLMLIYDEVQSGVGVTGKMWAHEHYGKRARPILSVLAKRLKYVEYLLATEWTK